MHAIKLSAGRLVYKYNAVFSISKPVHLVSRSQRGPSAVLRTADRSVNPIQNRSFHEGSIAQIGPCYRLHRAGLLHCLLSEPPQDESQSTPCDSCRTRPCQNQED